MAEYGRKTFYPELESLRGLAALSVVIGHSFIMFNFNPAPGFLHAGGWQAWANFAIHCVFDENSAIILFFVLSGFVLGVQLDGLEGTAWQRIAGFYVQRAFRILPPMYCAIAGAFIVKRFYGDSDASDAALIHALLLNPSELLGPLWTIVVEIGCSAAFPLIYFLVRSRRALPIVGAGFCLLWLQTSSAAPEWSRYAVFFFAGLLLEQVWPVMRLAPRTAMAAAFLAYGLPPAMAAAFSLPAMAWQRTVGLASLVMMAAVIYGGVFHWLLTCAPVRLVGRVSYSVYLIHYIILRAVMGSIVLPGLATPPTYPLAYQALAAVLTVPLTLAVSWVTHYMVERPSNRLGKILSVKLAAAPQVKTA